jgi:hypothetical protein
MQSSALIDHIRIPSVCGCLQRSLLAQFKYSAFVEVFDLVISSGCLRVLV